MAQDPVMDPADDAGHDTDDPTLDTTDKLGGDDDAQEPDLDAMAALFGDTEGQDDHDAIRDGHDATHGADHAQRGQSADKPWEQMTEEERRAGYMRQSDYTRKTQELSEQRRELQRQTQELLGFQSDALQRGQPQAPAGTGPAQQRQEQRIELKDCVDEDGTLDLTTLERYMAQERAAIRDEVRREDLQPVSDKLAAREQREADQAMLAERERLTRDFEMAKKALPHLAQSEAAQRRVIEYMGANRIRDFRAAYAACYPVKYAEAVMDFQRLRQQQQQRGTAAPVTPPGRQTRNSPSVPDASDEEAFDEAMADEAARLMGVRRR